MEERLRKFALLVDAESFTKAAREMHISQPALSTAIRKLERELRTPLLVRGNRKLQLTPAGNLAYATAKELSVSTSNLAARLTELSNQEISIAVGMIDSVASLLCQSARSINKLEAQAHVSLVVNNSRNLMQAVIDNQIDIAFVAEQTPTLNSILTSDYVGIEPLVLVCHRQQAAHTETAMQQWQHLPRFISYDQNSTTHRLIQKNLAGRGIQPETTFFSTSPEVMLRLVLLQKGCAVLPYHAVKRLIRRGTLVQLGTPVPIIIHRRIAVIRRRDKQATNVAEQLTSDIQALL